jgi:hypothetical protein
MQAHAARYKIARRVRGFNRNASIAWPLIRAGIARIEFLEINGSLCFREQKQIEPGRALLREVSLFLRCTRNPPPRVRAR